jgi:hypothetical protein
VNKHGLSDTIPAKIESGNSGHKTKFSYQVYLFQDLKSSVTYYHSDIQTLNHLMVNGKTVQGKGGGFKKCFLSSQMPPKHM